MIAIGSVTLCFYYSFFMPQALAKGYTEINRLMGRMGPVMLAVRILRSAMQRMNLDLSEEYEKDLKKTKLWCVPCDAAEGQEEMQ